ncbi:MAG: hypothetical protein CSB01_00500 [Bacteroidia bacterium]|nr:MAG: hypothetical protein CSB01_00500 [Bacteroidia bacterium]
MKLNIKYFAVLLFCVISCKQEFVYNEKIEIPQGNWHKDKIMQFKVKIEQNDEAHNLFFFITNNNFYAYSNLWLFVTSISPSGIARKDTVNCILADESGKWYGKRSREQNLIPAIFKRDVRFPEIGEYTFWVQQGMRHETLENIKALGLAVEKAETLNKQH